MKKFRLALLGLLLLLILAPWGYAGQTDLKILYVNDFHGFAEPYKANAGAAPRGVSPIWREPWTGREANSRVYCWLAGI